MGKEIEKLKVYERETEPAGGELVPSTALVITQD